MSLVGGNKKNFKTLLFQGRWHGALVALKVIDAGVRGGAISGIGEGLLGGRDAGGGGGDDGGSGDGASGNDDSGGDDADDVARATSTSSFSNDGACSSPTLARKQSVNIDPARNCLFLLL